MDTKVKSKEIIWQAVHHGAKIVSKKIELFSNKCLIQKKPVAEQISCPEVEAWRLFECLCLLSILVKADQIFTSKINNAFGRSGPIHIIEDGQNRFLWLQPTIRLDGSKLQSRPDIVITKPENNINDSTILRIIECKSKKRIGAPDIRSEFGKAYDLKVTSYLIWSIKTPSSNIIQGAKHLGLDIETIGMDTKSFQEFEASPGSLLLYVANKQESIRKSENFYKQLQLTYNAANTKLLS